MIYTYRQNNSGGYYTQPAKNIIVKNARDGEHACEIAMAAGMYLQGVAAGSDCSCCGDRWYPMANEYETMEDALLFITSPERLRDSAADGVPHYIVVDDLDVEDTVLE